MLSHPVLQKLAPDLLSHLCSDRHSRVAGPAFLFPLPFRHHCHFVGECACFDDLRANSKYAYHWTAECTLGQYPMTAILCQWIPHLPPQCYRPVPPWTFHRILRHQHPSMVAPRYCFDPQAARRYCFATYLAVQWSKTLPLAHHRDEYLRHPFVQRDSAPQKPLLTLEHAWFPCHRQNHPCYALPFAPWAQTLLPVLVLLCCLLEHFLQFLLGHFLWCLLEKFLRCIHRCLRPDRRYSYTFSLPPPQLCLHCRLSLVRPYFPLEYSLRCLRRRSCRCCLLVEVSTNDWLLEPDVDDSRVPRTSSPPPSQSARLRRKVLLPPPLGGEGCDRTDQRFPRHG
mmetsp:Transcript_55561/g.166543  ORF Transcript_55561/g.166543 Transcript_55561/m.166543 type:complete len:339 (+) Transcript_55561:1542-2558(+)